METLFLRVVHLHATHAYGFSGRSPEENAAIFGDLARPHPHPFRIEVEVAGPLDPETGFMVDLNALDALLHAEITVPFEGSHLNDVLPPVRDAGLQPSTEVLARWLASRIGARMPPGVSLRTLTVWESETLGARVRLDGAAGRGVSEAGEGAGAGAEPGPEREGRPEATP